jgi:hypothetical protein
LFAPGPCGPLNAQEQAKLLPKEGLSEAMPEVLLPRAGLSCEMPRDCFFGAQHALAITRWRPDQYKENRAASILAGVLRRDRQGGPASRIACVRDSPIDRPVMLAGSHLCVGFAPSVHGSCHDAASHHQESNQLSHIIGGVGEVGRPPPGSPLAGSPRYP